MQQNLFLWLRPTHTQTEFSYWYCIGFGLLRIGVVAGKAAGMEVVAVPSLPKQTHRYTSADEVINSLLDLQPEKWGLPPFQDCKPCPK